MRDARGSDVSSNPRPYLMDLIYWREMGRTGVVLTGLVLGLLCLFQLSAITVISTMSLSIMCFTLPVRLLYKALELFHWGSGAHPFQSYIEPDANLTDEQTIVYVQQIVVLTASAITKIKQLFFVADLTDSIKFVVLMYLLTYVGVLCNGLTLLIIGVICMFSVPLFYKRQQNLLFGSKDQISSCASSHIYSRIQNESQDKIDKRRRMGGGMLCKGFKS
ncbi:reticulon-2b isoform X2 [Anguilla rostrata]|uniref:reticulon-2b isoform X2 n=1 Tax=Anguilla rostrata TaxID=7938 RepID=UPI0030CEB5DD